MQDPRHGRRDYSKPHRLFVEDTPQEVRSILEEALGLLHEPPAPAPPVPRMPPVDRAAPPAPPA